jgi:repressor LexA
MNIASTRKGEQTRERIMQAIISYIEKHQYAPTVRELLEMTGIKSTSTIHRHILVLIDKGRLETDAEWGTPRALRVPGYKIIKEGDVHG